MKRDGLTFPEALKVLAAKAGVELDERTTREDARKARLRDVMESAIAFYHAVLTGSKTGQPALDYLRGRGFTDETIATHQLGCAPGGWDTLARQLAAKRQSPRRRARRGRARPAAPVGAGRRLRPVPRAGHLPDPRRERLRRSGSAAGSSAAPTDDGRDHGPKYLNSPATPLFDKSRTLYLDRPGQGADPQERPGGHRRGLHRRADGPPGRLRQRRRLARHRADARPGRAPDPLREADRARLRRRRRPARRRARSARRRSRRSSASSPRPTPASSSTRSGSSGCPTARTPTRSSARRPTAGARRSGRRSRSSTT